MADINNSGVIDNTVDSVQTLSINNLGTINVTSAAAPTPATLELASTLTGSAGKINISQSGTLQVDVAASGNTITFGDATGALTIDQLSSFASTMTIDGLQAGDTIFIPGLPAGFKESYSSTTGILTLKDAAGTTTLGSLVFGGTLPSAAVVQNAVVNVLPCFVSGTRIATERGAVAVEALRTGDRVPVLTGGKSQQIIWLGHRRVDCRRHPDPKDVWPICLSAGAFGPGRPFRDLWLSPDHALFINGVLVPIRYLVNGRTIRQEPRSEVTYWHVELAEHSVLYAEGVPAESYLDTGNRGAFANGGPVMDLHPDFSRHVWEAQGCAPLVVDGPNLAAAKRRLLTRASVLGHVITDEPNLTVRANGRTLRAAIDGRTWRVRLPKAAKTVRLVSRTWLPAHLQPDSDDLRTLGVAISRVWLDRCEIGLDSQVFSSGWYAPESEWRWTDGNASIAASGARELAFEIAMTGRYWQAGECDEVCTA